MIIKRRLPPTKLDTAPYGSICLLDGNDQEYYIQTSRDEEIPRWQHRDKVLLTIEEDYFLFPQKT